MDMSNTKIFLTGATGYIGAAVLQQLLSHPRRNTFDITVITRAPAKVTGLEELGVKAVVASYSDHDKLTELASESDAVFACADADDFGAAKAILGGLKLRYEKTGIAPILIHTSGTALLNDTADGLRANDTIYHDSDVQQMASLPLVSHRELDLHLVKADAEGYVKTFIILPSTIYGVGQGPLYDAGLANKHSIQIPSLIRAALDRGVAGMVGEGKNLWPNVHLDEVANLYVVLFDYATAHPSFDGHGANGYYFGESGEHVLTDVSKAIASALVALGKAKTEQVTAFTDEEIGKYYGGSKFMGGNARCRADHARSVGWMPKKTTEDMLASILPEMKAIVKA